MAPVAELFGERCARCGQFSEAASDSNEDLPEGYYIKVRRVTSNHKHRQTSRIFTCSKDCLIEFVKYGISHNSEPVEPNEI